MCITTVVDMNLSLDWIPLRTISEKTRRPQMNADQKTDQTEET